jgi:hypothetical protein
MIASTGYYTSFAALLATASRDSFFQNVRLLLNGESLVSATSNNVFVDSSASPLTIAATGNPAQGTFSPFRQPVNYSLDFSSSSSKSLVSGASGAAAIDAASSYTAEGFFYQLGQGGGTPGTTNGWYGASNVLGSGGAYDGCGFQSSTTFMVLQRSSAAYTTITLTTALPLNTWFHFALVCTVTSASSCTYKCYLNGVDVTSGTPTDTTTYSAHTGYYLAIGATTTNGLAAPFNGYISNLRFTTGATLYTGAFTPPTSALTTQVSSGTVRLLTANSNSYVNAGSTAMTLSATNVAITTLSPFNISAFTANNSADFSATGNKYIASQTGTAAAVDTSSSYTLEGFFYQNAQGTATASTPVGANGILNTTSSIGANPWRGWGFGNANLFIVTDRASSNGWVNITLSTALPLNQWFHFAFVATDSGGTSFTYKCYLNGVQVGTATDTATYAAFTSHLTAIGCASTAGATPFNGYISNLRFTNGAALYTSAFTPPNSQLTTSVSSGNVTLLTCNGPTFINQGSTSMTLTATNVTVSPLAPFSANSWSTTFNGSTDWFLLPTTQTALNFGTNNFTIECWVKLNATPTTNYTIFGARNTTDTAPFLFISATQIVWGGNVANFIAYTYTTTTLPIGQWVHLALVRSSTASTGTKLYLNGVLVATSALASAGNSFTYGTLAPGIGTNNNNAYYWNGYLSNLRVVNGTALYTANFPPPRSPLTAVPNTALLTLQDNRFVDRSPNAYALTRTGTPAVSSLSPFEPSSSYTTALGGSVLVSSTSYVSTNAITANGTGDFTAETWVYPTSLAAAQSVFGNYFLNSDTTWEVFLTITTGVPVFRGGTTTFLTSSTGIAVNTWNHIAVARSGTTLSMFLNGARVATTTNSTDFSSTNSYYVGRTSAGGQPLAGYVSDTRVVTNSVYDPTATTLSVPTSPLTAITNTRMLLSYTNSGIIDYSMSTNMAASSTSAAVSTSVVKYGARSLFIPTGSYITCDAPLYPATGAFTVEFWFYPITNATSQCLVTQYSGGTGRIDFRYADTANNFVVDCPTTGGGFGTITSTLSGGYATGTWHHVALTRSATNVFTLWVNGLSQGTPATSTVSLAQIATMIGSRNSDLRAVTNGYFDDIRITVGVARYTAAFTPPTGALPTA